MHRKFSASQMVLILLECEAATLRDFLTHMSSSPIGSALTNYHKMEIELDSERRLAELDTMMTIASKVRADIEKEKELAGEQVSPLSSVNSTLVNPTRSPAGEAQEATAAADPASTDEWKDYRIVQD